MADYTDYHIRRMVEALITGQYMASSFVDAALDNSDVVRQLRAALRGGREPATP